MIEINPPPKSHLKIVAMSRAGLRFWLNHLQASQNADSAGRCAPQQFVRSKCRNGVISRAVLAQQSVSGCSDVPLSAARDRRRSVFLHARAAAAVSDEPL